MPASVEVILLITPQNRVNGSAKSLPEIPLSTGPVRSAKTATQAGAEAPWTVAEADRLLERLDVPPSCWRGISAAAGAALLLLALSALGCKEPSPPAPDITPDACKALCSPHQVFSWTANSCICHAPCVDDDGQTDGGR